jgi:hypothetical protein
MHQRATDPEPSLHQEANKAGLTEDQLAFFTEQTRRAVVKSIRKVRRDSVAGFLVLVLGLAAAVWSFAHDADSARHAKYYDVDAAVARLSKGG